MRRQIASKSSARRRKSQRSLAAIPAWVNRLFGPVGRNGKSWLALESETNHECLVFGERHLNYLCSVFVDYYHRLRPHQAKDNELLLPSKRRRKKKPPRAPPPPEDVLPLSEVRCEQRLGGLLKHYYRKAA